jgi:hypothetical protein
MLSMGESVSAAVLEVSSAIPPLGMYILEKFLYKSVRKTCNSFCLWQKGGGANLIVCQINSKVKFHIKEFNEIMSSNPLDSYPATRIKALC